MGRTFRMFADGARLAAGLALSVKPVRRSVRDRLGQRKHRADIFYYHRVYRTDEQPLYQLGISQEQFRRQITDLCKSYQFLPLRDFLHAAEGNAADRDLASLTFDDGYVDNLQVALPILLELRVPATVFLVTGLIGTRELLWYDQVKTVFEQADPSVLRFLSVLGGGSASPEARGGRRRSFLAVLDRLKALEDTDRRRAVRDLVAASGVDLEARCERDRLLTWEEARRMEDLGVRFGSHTMTHPLLPRVANPRVLRAELTEALELLNDRLADPLPVLAYPGGAWSPAVDAAVRDAGYSWACTTYPGDAGLAESRWRLPRRGIGPGSSAFLGARHSVHILRAETEGVFDSLRGKPPRRAGPKGAVVSRPAGEKQLVEAAFDDAAEKYLHGRRGDPAFEGEAEEIARMVPATASMAIEIGCGVGITSLRLAQSGWSVIATDISFEMLRRVRDTQQAIGKTLLSGLVQCDVQRMPFRDDCAAFILCHGVLEYVPEVPRALEEMARTLRRDGVLVATIPNRLAPAYGVAWVLRLVSRLRQAVLRRPARRVPTRAWPPWKLDRLAARAGFMRDAGVVQTFGLLPAYLFPRPWLALNNRIMRRLPRHLLLRWWGTQYIARFTQRD